MNILTFDIEDWYNCDFLNQDYNWDKYEVRIYESVDKILNELSDRNLSATFFCLGWLAEKHPDVIKKIHQNGHHIGCHSYQHDLVYNLDEKSFRADILKAKNLIENVIGEPIVAYRAPGFSITENNIWALEIIAELGFEYDCSLFPAKHDYGGFQNYGQAEPSIIILPSGKTIKEFPMSIKKVWNKSIVFSGGGFFRFFPYYLIKNWSKDSNYLMTYFHPRDFDPNQPVVKNLPLIRKYKSYVGLSKSFDKFKNFLNDFDFISVLDADKIINWEKVRTINL